MSEIGSLVVTLEANMAQYATDMGRAAAVAEQRSKEINKAIGSITGALAAVGVGVSIVGVFHELKASLDEAISTAAGLENLANRTGATVEGLSALSNVARFSNVSTDDLSRSLSILSKTLIDAENGGKKSTAAFNSIGLAVENLKGLKPDEVFTKVALATNQYSDGTEKLVINQALMGKGAAALLPMFRDMANAGDLVASTTTHQAQMADEYEKNLIRVRIAHEKLAFSIAEKTLPAQLVLTTAMMEFVKQLGNAGDKSGLLSNNNALESWAFNTALAVGVLVDGLVKVGLVAVGVGYTVATAVKQLADIAMFRPSQVVADGAQYVKDMKALMDVPSLADEVQKKMTTSLARVKLSAPTVDKGAPNVSGLGSANGPKDDPTHVLLKDRLTAQENFNKESDRLLADHLKTVDWLNKNEILSVRETEGIKQNLIANELAQKELVWSQEEKLINASIRASLTAVDRAKGHEQLTVLEGKRTLELIAAGDALVVSQRKLLDVQLELNTATLEFSRVQKLGGDQSLFELDMLGKSSLHVAQLTAGRKIQLEVDEKIRQARKKDPEVDSTGLMAEGAVAIANAQDAVTASFNKQQSAVFGVNEAFRKYSEIARNTGAQLENVMTKAFSGMEDALVNFVMTGKLNFTDLANSIIADIARIIIRQELSNALGIGGGSGGGGSSMIAGLFKSVLGFAGGGSPPVGQVSMVGESGPELFVPRTAGTIIPNSALGGGGNMVVNIVEAPGQGGQQSRTTSNGVDTLTIMVEKIKSSIAGDIKNGSGAIPAAMSSTYGMNRTVGAF